MQIAKVINNALNRNFPDNNINIIAEPGRYFATTPYTLICKIHGKRELKANCGKLLKKMYFINDGIYGTFNYLLYEQHNVIVKHFLVR